MKLRNIILILLAGLLSGILAVPTAHAGPVTYSPGDLFLGFRASDGTGATKDYLVNIGQASVFRNATSPLTVSGLGGIGTDLNAIFGSNWANRADVLWSVSGASGSSATASDPARTLYATSAEPTPGTLGPVRTRATLSAQAGPNNKLLSLGGAFVQTAGVPNTSSANSNVAVIQNTTDSNSYASFQIGGSSYSYFSPSIEGDFTAGVAGSVLDLYRITPASGTDIGTPGELLGTFTISAAGELLFTPASSLNGTKLHFDNAQYTINEADASGHVVIRIVREGDTAGTSSVNLNTSAGTALAGTDFTAQSNVAVQFAAQQTEATVAIDVVNRAGYHGDRSFTVALSGATGAGVIAPATATVTILEADAAPAGQIAFDASTYQVSATNAQNAPNSVTVNLSRTNGSAGAVSVDVSVTGGTLVNGTDYASFTNPTTVTFPAGVTTKTVTLQLNAIAAVNLPGTIQLGLTNATGGATLGAQTSTTVTVAATGNVAFASATYQIAEGSSDVQLTISAVRTGGQNGAVSVDVAATGGTATGGTDYTFTPVTLAWASNETGTKSFTITIKADAVAEASGETITFALQNAQGGVALGAQSTTTVTIVDADSVAPSLTVVSPKANGKFSGSTVTVSGNAKDNQGVARVEVKLNGGAPQVLTPTSATASYDWTINLTPEQGSNTVEVTAFDAQNNAAPVATRTFTFVNVRPQLAGVYNGLLKAAAGIATPLDHNGLVSIKVTSTGAFTGKVTLRGATLPISGTFQTGGDARFGKLGTPTFELVSKSNAGTVSVGQLALTLDVASGLKITGTVKDAATAGANTLAIIDHADRALYTAKKDPVAPLANVPVSLLDPTREKGKYTAVFQAGDAPNNGVEKANFPQGDGVGTVTISSAGVVKIVGKLADGSAISYSNTLSKNNEWPLFVPLYSKQGFVIGNIVFDPSQPQTDATGADVKWFKPAGLPKKALYPAGWPNGIDTDFVASKYIAPAKASPKVPAPANPDTVLGAGATAAALPTTANIVITAADGGITTVASNEASLDANSKVNVLGAATGATAIEGLRATFAAATGSLSGSFVHPVSGKKVTFTGVAFQKTQTASGFFLNTQGTPAASGAIGVARK